MIHMIKDKDKKMISNSVKGWNFMVIKIIIENIYPSLADFIIFHKETWSFESISHYTLVDAKWIML